MPVFKWLAKLLEDPAPAESLEKLKEERLRELELLACCKEMGFDSLIPDRKNRLAWLRRRILDLERAEAGRPPDGASP